jgi:tRNA pseudouridine55 synthase
VPVWLGGEKTYEATIRFGVETRTQDLQGEVVAEREPVTDETRLREGSRMLVGDLDQVPPMVSAIRVRGQRLHRLARQGLEVARAPRRVHVAEWTWLEFSGREARCRIRCSGGTYVRTLAHDLGSRLGCGAALAALRRVRSAPFDLSRSVTVDALRVESPQEIWRRGGIPLAQSLAHLPHATIESSELALLGHGNPVRRSRESLAGVAAGTGSYGLVMTDVPGTPLALGEVRPDPADATSAWLQPRVVLPWAVCEGRA